MLALTMGYVRFDDPKFAWITQSGHKTAEIGSRTSGFKHAPSHAPEKTWRAYAREFFMLDPVNMNAPSKPSGSELQKLGQRSERDRKRQNLQALVSDY